MDVTHEGEEFVYVLEGELHGEIGGQAFQLKAGDSLFLRSTAPHIFYNPTDKVTRAVTVIYPY
jgi:quercetin dioxygenase-like cupin family protein